jgi:hypothetical protein
MAAPTLLRTGGGLASIAAGVLLLLGHLANLGGDLDYGTVLGSSLVLAAHMLLVFALIAIYAVQAEQGDILNSLGMVLGVLGTTLNCAAIFVEIAGAGGLEVRAVLTSGLTAPLVLLGGLAFLVGLILLGVAIMRAGVFPRWAGLLLIAGDIVFAAGTFAGTAAPMVYLAGAALTCAAFVWLGVALLQGLAAQPAGAAHPHLA